MSMLKIARPELLKRTGYQAALGRFDLIRLHANEMPDTDTVDHLQHATDDSGLNRYPPPRPTSLTERLSQVLKIDASQMLITRGSNEGIDLLVRAFCRSGKDAIAACTPTFGMYKICAEVQDAAYLEIPLNDQFDLDVEQIISRVTPNVKLVFLCSPGNPTGRTLDTAKLLELCQSLQHQALVVLDQAYAEFCATPTGLSNIGTQSNLVILRTFSKAHGLAGLRCGVVIAADEIITLLDSLQPPYAIPTPTIDGVVTALSPDNLSQTYTRIDQIRHARQLLQTFLIECALVENVYPSDANFLLVKFNDAARVYQQLIDHGILVRNFSSLPRLKGCLRITIGNEQEIKQLKNVLQELC